MNHSEICLDLSVPLHMRLEHLAHLDDNEVDNVLECVCSMYNIHPTFLAAQYIQSLILDNRACLRRRIRLAEACDLGRTVLYLLTRMLNPQERISCIEMFENPFLKVHAYAVLYTRATVDVRVQIMKNLYTLGVLRASYLAWFQAHMRDETLEYTMRANCADFILRHDPNAEHQREARAFLKILEPIADANALYAHRENVHAFVPRVYLLEKILTDPDLEPCHTDRVFQFLEENKYDTDLFRQRIVNDKTQLGTLRYNCTLEQLLCRVWNALTDDLRHMLVQDIESSVILDEAWLCTTGYYHRILNVYQSIADASFFDNLFDLEAFQDRFTEKLNQYMQGARHQDDIFLELADASESLRIRYLEFRIHSLPQVIDEMRAEYAELDAPVFDEWINLALRKYEM